VGEWEQDWGRTDEDVLEDRDGNGYIPVGYDLPIPTPTIGKTPHHPYPSPTTGLKFHQTHHPSGSGYLAGDPYPLHYNCS
jgi:hypothetical protein